MTSSNKEIIDALKDARKKKGLSQRGLSKKVGIHQSHISKIENGDVDLQLSSLMQISRCLDLEVMLIPRPLILSVLAVLQSGHVEEIEQTPLYRLHPEVE